MTRAIIVNFCYHAKIQQSPKQRQAHQRVLVVRSSGRSSFEWLPSFELLARPVQTNRQMGSWPQNSKVIARLKSDLCAYKLGITLHAASEWDLQFYGWWKNTSNHLWSQLKEKLNVSNYLGSLNYICINQYIFVSTIIC